MLPGPLRGSFESVSEHVVYSSGLYAELRTRMIRMESAMIDFSLPARTEADHRAYRAAQLIRPFATDVPLLRVGDAGDGGYVMADAFDVPKAISLGVGPNVSWDADIARHGIDVAMFDPTVSAPPHDVPRSSFHRIGLGTPEQARTLGMELVPFDQILSLAGTEASETIVKIDIEGAEWDALASVTDYTRFPQIALEMHDLVRLSEMSSAANVLAVLEALHHTHLPVHVHANNEVPAMPFGRYWLPGTLEVSYLRRDLAVGAVPASSIDTALDSPSNARFADVSLDGLLSVAPIA